MAILKPSFSCPLWVLVLTWLAVRFTFLLTGSGEIFSFDEFEIGTVAKEIHSGLKLPYWQYQVDAYSGESLFFSPLLALFFKCFGPVLFSLKFLPFFCSFLTFTLALIFLKRFFGNTAAWTGGLLLIFPPLNFFELSFLAMSGHTETLLLAMAALFFFFEALWGTWNSRRCLAAAAFLSGLSVWIYYENLILVSACFFSGFLFRRDLRKPRRVSNALLFFTLGFSPWIIYNFRTEFSGLSFFTEAMGAGQSGMAAVLKRAAKFLVFDLPFSFQSRPVWGIPAGFFSAFYGVLFAILPWVFAAHSHRPAENGKKVFFAVYFFLFTAFYALSPAGLQPEFGAYGYRYLAPLYFLGCLAWGITFSISSLKGRGALFSVLLFLGMAAQAPLFFKHSPEKLFQYKGYSYYHYAVPMHLAGSYKTLSYQDWKRAAVKFPERERFFLTWGILDILTADNQPHFLSPDGTVEDVLKNIPQKTLPFYYGWLGSAFSPTGTREMVSALQAVPEKMRVHYLSSWFLNRNAEEIPAEIAAQFSPQEKKFLAFVLGEMLYQELTEQSSESSLQEVLDRAKPEEKIWILRGIGSAYAAQGNHSFADAHKNGFAKINATLSTLELPEVYWGLGWGLRLLFREDDTRAMDMLVMIPAPYLSYGANGFKTSGEWHGLV